MTVTTLALAIPTEHTLVTIDRQDFDGESPGGPATFWLLNCADCGALVAVTHEFDDAEARAVAHDCVTWQRDNHPDGAWAFDEEHDRLGRAGVLGERDEKRRRIRG